jgi:hypothetical protein
MAAAEIADTFMYKIRHRGHFVFLLISSEKSFALNFPSQTLSPSPNSHVKNTKFKY